MYTLLVSICLGATFAVAQSPQPFNPLNPSPGIPRVVFRAVRPAQPLVLKPRVQPPAVVRPAVVGARQRPNNPQGVFNKLPAAGIYDKVPPLTNGKLPPVQLSAKAQGHLNRLEADKRKLNRRIIDLQEKINRRQAATSQEAVRNAREAIDQRYKSLISERILQLRNRGGLQNFVLRPSRVTPTGAARQIWVHQKSGRQVGVQDLPLRERMRLAASLSRDLKTLWRDQKATKKHMERLKKKQTKLAKKAVKVNQKIVRVRRGK